MLWPSPSDAIWTLPTEHLVDGFRGKTNIKILKLAPPPQGEVPITHSDMRNLVQSLSQNQGLEELDFGQHAFCDKKWSILCQSIARHPTLVRMKVTIGGYLQQVFLGGNEPFASLSDSQKTRRTEMLLEMLKVNTVLHNITLTLKTATNRS